MILTEAKTNTVCICEQVFLGEDRLDLFREFFGFLKIFGGKFGFKGAAKGAANDKFGVQ